MRLLLSIFLCVALSGCDPDVDKDLFLGVWGFQFNGLTGEMELSPSEQYIIKNVRVNNELWSRAEVRDVEKGKTIGQIIISKSNVSTLAIALFNCRISSNTNASMVLDSAYVYDGSIPPKITVYKNQTLTRH